jgi:hypothetical protein
MCKKHFKYCNEFLGYAKKSLGMKLGNTSNMIPYDDVFVLFVNIYGGHT